MIVSTSEQVALSPEDLARIGSAEPPRDQAEWLAREREHFRRHESPALEKAEDLLYLTEADVVEKFSEDQPRDERGRWTEAGGTSAAATGAAARANGWRPSSDLPRAYEHPQSEDIVHVHEDGSWHRSGPWESGEQGPFGLESGVERPTVARGATSEELDRHLGGGAEEIPPEPEDLVGARPLDERDAAVSAEDEAWLAEVERDPDVARALEVERTGTPTDRLYKDARGVWAPERAALHEQVAEEMLKPGAARAAGQQKTAILMIGPGGAGKTTTLGLVLRKPEKFSVISADYAKERLPGYDGYNSSMVHEESTHVADVVAFGKALERNHNLVLDATGKTSAKYEQMAERLHRLGYNVQALHVDVPTSVAARRVVARFKGMKAAGEAPRFSNPRRVLYDTDAKPTVTYNNLKRKGLLSRAMEYDANGPPGSAPRKVEDIDYRRQPAASKRGGAPGRAPGGGHPEDAGPGALAPRAKAVAKEIGRAVAEAIRDASPVQGPAVKRLRKVRKTVVRDERGRIREVIEEEIE